MLTRIKFASNMTPGPVTLNVDSDQWTIDIVAVEKKAEGKTMLTEYSIEAWLGKADHSRRYVKISDGEFKTLDEARRVWHSGFITDPPNGTYHASAFVKQLLANELVELA